MPDKSIYVDDELFLGRLDEQERFREVLNTLLASPLPPDETPYIFLIYGEGGMGKSKLLRRFRDIATLEPPFEREYQSLFIDWELERFRSPDLQVARDTVQVEVVFDHLHRAAVDKGWSRYFRSYQEAVRRRTQTEQKVIQALQQESGESRYAAVRDLGAEGLAALIRRGIGLSERWQTPLSDGLGAVVQGGAERLASLRSQADEWLKLRARLKPEEEAIYRQPNDHLARALAEGFKEVTRNGPLVLMMDTYELVDRADPALRIVIQAAGPKVVWVIAGRDNLVRSRSSDKFVGYSGEFSRRLIHLDVQELAIDYVADYFQDRAPHRPITREQAEALHQAMQGVPLALRQAADLWARGEPLSAITEGIPDPAPRDEIVRLMSERILLHCDNPDERRALYLLAMQRRPDARVHTAVLRTTEGPFDLMACIQQLAVRYSAVRTNGGGHLHDASAAFMREYLLSPEMRTAGGDLRTIAGVAWNAAEERKRELEAELPLLEERYASEDWQEAVLDTVHWLFWYDETAAWFALTHHLIPAFAYEPNLAHALLEVVRRFERGLSRDGRKRLKTLQAGFSGRRFGSLTFADGSAEEEAMLDELARLLDRNVGADSFTSERRAILNLQRGRLLFRRKHFRDALKCYQLAEDNLPANGVTLKEQLADALNDLAGELMWPDKSGDAIYSAEAEQFLKRIVTWFPTRQNAWYTLGVAAAKSGRSEDAIAAFQRAIELDPRYAHPHNGLGNVYLDLGRFEEAIAAYQRAIELDPRYAYPHNGLGHVYRTLVRYEEAIAAYQRAIALDLKHSTVYASLAACYRKLGREADYQESVKMARDLISTENEYNRACLEAIAGNVEEALALLEVALEKRQTSLEWARRDADFDFIRDDPRFQALVGEEPAHKS